MNWSYCNLSLIHFWWIWWRHFKISKIFIWWWITCKVAILDFIWAEIGDFQKSKQVLIVQYQRILHLLYHCRFGLFALQLSDTQRLETRKFSFGFKRIFENYWSWSSKKIRLIISWYKWNSRLYGSRSDVWNGTWSGSGFLCFRSDSLWIYAWQTTLQWLK